jgi:glycosyltransferase involved in cell wall biosynthesis
VHPPAAAPPAPAPLRVLAVCDYYLPGVKAGGPVRSLSALAGILAGQVELAVLTRDRDLGDTAPYPGVKADVWTRRGDAPVRYASPAGLKARGLRAALHARDYDVLYLNSLWSAFTRRILLLRRVRRLPARPMVLAPRGELAEGALCVRRARKLAFLAAARAAGLLEDIVWQATSPAELRDVARRIGPRAAVVLAPNAVAPAQRGAFERPAKVPGELRLVFLSRLSEKKNLLGALELLRGVEGRVTLDVYGSVEHEEYWLRCRRVMDALPANVACSYRGWLPPEQVPETLARYHVFLLPTFDENFGHAIVEAMLAGCPPLISDRTPWHGLALARAGWDLPLEDPYALREALAQAVAMDQPTWQAWAMGTRAFAEARVHADVARDAHLHLFRLAAGRRRDA